METQLPRSTPKSEGLDPAAINRFIRIAEEEKFTTHSLVIVRHGKVISETWWEPYQRDEYHLLYSLTKSFASTAIGLAISEGAFTLDDLVVDLLPEQVPSDVSPNLAKLKVRHLLSMSVGHEAEPSLNAFESDWQTYATGFLAHPVPYEPGTHFVYNTASSNMLSVLIQKRMGETLDDFLEKRLFQKLGISNVLWTRGEDFVWGGSGLHATTETIAKLGLLYLNKGVWDGEQLLPKGWAETATTYQVANGPDPDNDWNQGYCFQFWRCRHNSVRGDGAFGQYCLMIPEKDAVIAITSGNSDMQRVLNVIWEHILPAFDSDFENEEPIPTERTLSPIDTTPHPTKFSAKGEGFSISLENGEGALFYRETVPLNTSEWVEFQYGFGQKQSKKARAKAGWTSLDTLEVEIWDPHTPHQHSFTVKTDGSVTFRDRGTFWPLDPLDFKADVEA